MTPFENFVALIGIACGLGVLGNRFQRWWQRRYSRVTVSVPYDQDREHEAVRVAGVIVELEAARLRHRTMWPRPLPRGRGGAA